MLFKATAMCLLTLSPIAISGQSPIPYQLPSKVKESVDRNYPGWNLLYPTKACNGEFNRAVLTGDFNGDGAKDYVIKIEKDKNGTLLALLSDKGAYRQKTLIQQPAREIKNLGFTLGRKGTRLIKIQTGRVQLERDAVFVKSCATGRNANYYVFRSGGFEPLL